MGGDDFLNTEEEVGTEEPDAGRKYGLFSGLTIQILKWVAIILGSIIFVVTVVVVTLNIMDANGVRTAELPTSEALRQPEPIYDYFTGVGEVRGQTADRENTFMIEVILGIDQDATALQSELVARRSQIRDIVRRYFANRTEDQLLGEDNEMVVKQELRARINDILRSGRIREILFDEYQIVPF